MADQDLQIFLVGSVFVRSNSCSIMMAELLSNRVTPISRLGGRADDSSAAGTSCWTVSRLVVALCLKNSPRAPKYAVQWASLSSWLCYATAPKMPVLLQAFRRDCRSYALSYQCLEEVRVSQKLHYSCTQSATARGVTQLVSFSKEY